MRQEVSSLVMLFFEELKSPAELKPDFPPPSTFGSLASRVAAPKEKSSYKLFVSSVDETNWTYDDHTMI